MAKPVIPLLHVVGCGGVASYLIPALIRTFEVQRLILQDGDTLEERNLDRQLFSAEQIGKNKAQALADLLGLKNAEVLPEYFSTGSTVNPGSVVVGAVDNHTARMAMLDLADLAGAQVVFASNEYLSSMGMYYSPRWRGTKRDPRVRYSEMANDHEGDPLRPESCQGPAQQKNSQLAMANFGAANYALWLLWFWLVSAQELDRETLELAAPVEHFNNFNKFRTTTTGDLPTQ